jgi:hypothetical protein
MSQPATEQPTIRHGVAQGCPWVRGKCPACGGTTLFLGSGGYVTCSWIRCANPVAPSEALGIVFPTDSGQA